MIPLGIPFSNVLITDWKVSAKCFEVPSEFSSQKLPSALIKRKLLILFHLGVHKKKNRKLCAYDMI